VPCKHLQCCSCRCAEGSCQTRRSAAFLLRLMRCPVRMCCSCAYWHLLRAEGCTGMAAMDAIVAGLAMRADWQLTATPAGASSPRSACDQAMLQAQSHAPEGVCCAGWDQVRARPFKSSFFIEHRTAQQLRLSATHQDLVRPISQLVPWLRLSCVACPRIVLGASTHRALAAKVVTPNIML
jgi:hypothetical protein